MEFRPCIDIHNGKVKQIVGSSLKDAGNFASENFVADKSSVYYASLYRNDGIKGAHVIMLNSKDSEFYDATKASAISALKAYPGGLQIGGGINSDNAFEFINEGASHVIVTSYAFSNGLIQYSNLDRLKEAVGKEHIVLDLSAGFKDGKYLVVTDRWQKYTDEEISIELFQKLSDYCDEFLVHGIDTEGKKKGPDEKLLKILAKIADSVSTPITYAGGIACKEDIELVKRIGNGKINYTIGSALDLFGGNLSYNSIVNGSL